MTTIVITAGHSNTDPGAVYGEYKEATLAVELRNIICHYLKEWGYNTITDGDGKDNRPLKEAIAKIKQGAVAVEIHFNAASNKSAKGVETFAQPKNRVLAQALSKAVSDVLDTPLRGKGGWKEEGASQHSRLGYVRNGGLLMEIEFISNPEAMQQYVAKKWLVGKAIAETIDAHVKQ